MIKLRAHNCIIKDLTKQEEKDFLNKYHYQGFIGSSLAKGLYYKGELVEVMTFGKPRYNNSYDWELLRLCTKKDYQVYGGASKLFKSFELYGSVISYCNESKFNGNVYKALGFTRLGKCNSYHYEKDDKSYHRSNFQRHKLFKMFPQYDSNWTERMIMRREGYTRIEETQATWVLGCKWYIYKITNKVNGKTYIGQHMYRHNIDDNYYGSGTIITRTIKKYGKENLIKSLLIVGINNREDADKYERCLIFQERLNGHSEYNVDDGGHPLDNCAIFHKERNSNRKNETRIAWNKGLTGYTQKAHSEQGKLNQSNGLIEYYKEHPEAKKSISERMKGNKNAKAYSQWKCVETNEIKSRAEWLKLGYNPSKIKTKGRTFINLRQL